MNGQTVDDSWLVIIMEKLRYYECKLTERERGGNGLFITLVPKVIQ